MCYKLGDSEQNDDVHATGLGACQSEKAVGQLRLTRRDR